MTRALLAQINYIVDVAAKMPATRTPRPAGSSASTEIHHDCGPLAHGEYVPQPVASCLRNPPAGTQPPALSPVAFHPSAPSPVDFVHARWKFEHPLSLSGPFVKRCQSRLRFGPRLIAACAALRACTDPGTALVGGPLRPPGTCRGSRFSRVLGVGLRRAQCPVRWGEGPRTSYMCLP